MSRPRQNAECGTVLAYRYGCRCEDCRAACATAKRADVAERRQRPLPVDDPRHGTPSTYTNWACRCDLCTASWRAFCQTQRENRAARLTPGDRRHGSFSTYTNYGCRCDACVAARREYQRQYNAQRRRTS